MAHIINLLVPTRYLAHLTLSKRLAPCLPSAISGCTLSRQFCAPSLLHLQNYATCSSRPSLASRAADFPEVIRQWHPSRNMLQPEDVAPFSAKSCWFVCDEGHEYKAIICNRTKHGTGCPTCRIKRATQANNLLTKYPAVAAEWHCTKNGTLAPKDVSYGSNKKVWWQCKQGHEWKVAISTRTYSKAGCPVCAVERQQGTRKGTQSLLAAYPHIAKFWHPTRNGVLTPDAVSYGSNRKVWWQCANDGSHEWEARVRNCTRQKLSCPFCN
eukprot:Colp12_sorted_trinity150504_noHs@13815